LGFLEGYSSIENIRGKAKIEIEKAVKLNLTDWISTPCWEQDTWQFGILFKLLNVLVVLGSLIVS
jgi:hypothetical protein